MFELTLNPRGIDAGDAGSAVDGVRLDAGLSTVEAHGGVPEVIECHREQRGRSCLPGREQNVHLALVRDARDALSERDQLVGAVAHRRDHSDDAAPLLGTRGDALRDVANAVGIGDRAATVLLDDERTHAGSRSLTISG